MTGNTAHPADRRNDAVDRVAIGVKTALIVCAVGFVALVANRALVSPTDNAADTTMPAAAATDMPAPTAAANDRPMLALPAPAAVDGGAQFDGGDNHPPSF